MKIDGERDYGFDFASDEAAAVEGLVPADVVDALRRPQKQRAGDNKKAGTPLPKNSAGPAGQKRRHEREESFPRRAPVLPDVVTQEHPARRCSARRQARKASRRQVRRVAVKAHSPQHGVRAEFRRLLGGLSEQDFLFLVNLDAHRGDVFLYEYGCAYQRAVVNEVECPTAWLPACHSKNHAFVRRAHFMAKVAGARANFENNTAGFGLTALPASQTTRFPHVTVLWTTLSFRVGGVALRSQGHRAAGL